MGIADAIPGVSGGTMALITGIYDRLISVIASIDTKIPIYFLRGDFGSVKEKIKKIDFGFLIPLVLGIALALFIFSKFILEFLSTFMYSLFFGLVLSSGIIIYVRHRTNFGLSEIFLSILGFLSSMSFSLLVIKVGESSLPHNMIISFLSGVLAICAMILPGISGAFMLLLVGQYEYMISVLHSLPSSLATLIVFGVGALVGIFSFTKPLSYLLENFRTKMMSFLSGLMLGALTMLLHRIYTALGPSGEPFDFLGIGIAGVIGVSLVVILEGLSGFSYRDKSEK